MSAIFAKSVAFHVPKINDTNYVYKTSDGMLTEFGQYYLLIFSRQDIEMYLLDNRAIDICNKAGVDQQITELSSRWLFFDYTVRQRYWPSILQALNQMDVEQHHQQHQHPAAVPDKHCSRSTSATATLLEYTSHCK